MATPSHSEFFRLQGFVTSLEAFASAALMGRHDGLNHWTEHDHSSFSSRLRESVSLAARQQAGTFFTAPSLGARALSNASTVVPTFDPACGAGDLLLSLARRLPLERSLDATLEAWSERLRGTELHPVLVRGARARLVLTAVQRHALNGKPSRVRRSIDSLFARIRSGNGLEQGDELAAARQIVLNPPFAITQAPDYITWARGSVTAAALFVHHCLQSARSGSTVVAILPDVLRSGSRYAAWRRWVESRMANLGIEVVGAFDKHTDVDVFLLRGVVREAPALNGKNELEPASSCGVWVAQALPVTIGSFFDVRVGPLVAYRAPESGPWRPFLDVSRAPAWGEATGLHPYRRFRGPAIDPPFIVLRRTSSPRDRVRLVPTLVRGDRSVAVENHLIVLQPKDRLLATCEAGLAVLASREAEDWIDQRIRCRHLTVDSIKEIPWAASLRQQ